MTNAPATASINPITIKPHPLRVGPPAGTSGAATPPLPVLSVLFERFESVSAGVAVALLSKAPVAVIVAVTLIVVLAPEARLGMVHGSEEQPLPLTFVMLMFVGVSVT